MTEGTSFRRMIPEEGAPTKNPANVKRIIFCSGKVYYDLVKERATRGFDDSVAIARLEQVIYQYCYIIKGLSDIYRSILDRSIPI